MSTDVPLADRWGHAVFASPTEVAHMAKKPAPPMKKSTTKKPMPKGGKPMPPAKKGAY